MTVSDLLHDLQQTRFYGSVELKYEAGRVVLVKRTETLKPQECRDNRGATDEYKSTR